MSEKSVDGPDSTTTAKAQSPAPSSDSDLLLPELVPAPDAPPFSRGKPTPLAVARTRTLTLQRVIGNRATQRLLAQRALHSPTPTQAEARTPTPAPLAPMSRPAPSWTAGGADDAAPRVQRQHDPLAAQMRAVQRARAAATRPQINPGGAHILQRTRALVVQRVGGEKAGFDPNAIVKETFKQDVQTLFDLARKLNKLKKDLATNANSAALTKLEGEHTSELSTTDLAITGLNLTDKKAQVAKALEPQKRKELFPGGGKLGRAQKADVTREAQLEVAGWAASKLETFLKEKNKETVDKEFNSKKGQQVKGTYATELSAINLDTAWLSTVLEKDAQVQDVLTKAKASTLITDGEILALNATLLRLRGNLELNAPDKKLFDKTWKPDEGGARAEAQILEGKAIFVKKDMGPAGAGYRDVYQKLGKAGGDNNEYVLDDLGNHTRRYAYMEKSYHQAMAYKETGFLTGKTQDLAGAAAGKSADTMDPTDFANQNLTQDEQGLKDVYAAPGIPNGDKLALAYMHQWKGSGPGQRGLSLASTPRDNAVFGNAGDSFRSEDGVKFKVDLAKVNPADNILLNHYAPGGALRAKLPADGANVHDRRLGGHYQYERSVIKNRELYLKKLTPEAVVGITSHAPGANLDRDSATFIENKKHATENAGIERKLATKREQLKQLEAQQVSQGENMTALVEAEKKLDQPVQAAQPLPKKEEEELAALELRAAGGALPGPLGEKLARLRKKKEPKGPSAQQKKALEKNRADQQELLKQQQELQKQIVDLKAEIALLETQRHAAPDGSDLHAKHGWDTGQSYNEGYAAGLKAKQSGATERERIIALSKAAYGDKNKYTPYWQGFGKGLN